MDRRRKVMWMAQTTDGPGDDIILEHYEKEARAHGLEGSSTMADEITRALEVDTALACLAHVVAPTQPARLLEIGCGNGLMLQTVAGLHPQLQLTGVDYSPHMVELAQGRGIPGCDVRQGDVRALDFPDGTFDVVLSERCVINLLDEDDQMRSFEEIHRVLAPGGHLVFIEAFTDGFANLNLARDQLGLAPTAVPHHNRWLDKATFQAFVDGRFADVSADDPGAGLPPRNFLSSHYFVSRVFYPSVTRREVMYNTEFVKFFRFLPPQGLYSPIQLFFLRKLTGTGA
jgi:SAM-dependent methyltransferase